MKDIQIISESRNHTAGNLGSLDELATYAFLHPKLNREFEGKVFISEKLKTTGVEVSFQVMPPRAEMPFFHQHTQNEEVYIFLKGQGLFQVDEACFEVEEGSIVRIAPQAARCWKNGSDAPMVFMVIQARQDSLEYFGVSDGSLAAGKTQWIR